MRSDSPPGTPVVLDVIDPAALEAAVAALAAGKVVVVPTDTVYGLAVDPTDPGAVAGLFALKGRPDSLSLPVLVAGLDQVLTLVDAISEQASTLAGRFWPGPLTLVLTRRTGIELHLGATVESDTDRQSVECDTDRHTGSSGTVGVRCPDHAMLRDLCRATGPLAVTSANRHGEPPCTSVAEVLRALTGLPVAGPAFVLDGGRCDGAVSTVVDLTGPEPRCLREGALSWASVLSALGC